MPRPRSSKPRSPRARPAPPGLRNPTPGEAYNAVFQGRMRGGGFAVLEAPDLSDVFIPEEFAGTALHGDQVLVRVVRITGRGPVGEVEKVLRHHNKHVVGQLFRSRRISVVIPKNSKLARTVEIPRIFSEEEVPDGAWVVAEVTRWSRSTEEPLQGRLHEVLGVEGEQRLPILLLIRGQGVVQEFPPEVEAEAERVAEQPVPEPDLGGRTDFRNHRICTIDPATAKDFDDAIHLVGRAGDGWRVGVHIADVAHYVRSGSAIDVEAYDRATSIYPVDRVIPMLPEALSNRACSLRPDEDKFTLSAIFTVTPAGRIKDVEVHNGIIRSVRRFAYEEVQALYDQADGVDPEADPSLTEEETESLETESDTPHPAAKIRRREPVPPPEVDPALREDLLILRDAARALRAARDRRGALDLDLAEPQIVFDENGIVSDVRRRDRLEAHRFIEDLMVAANEAVAEEMKRRNLPVLYRVHDVPNEEKLEALRPAFARFRIHLPGRVSGSEALASALEQAAKHPAGEVIMRWVLRALPRAVYQPKNIGHYGLGSTCYLHFTSPIRRYPDLVVHRAVKAMLEGPEAIRKWTRSAEEHLPDWGRHTSEREQRAQRIEWDAEKILSYEFMKRHLGGVFDGYIAGANAKGFFVELVEYPVEGFVPIRMLTDDFYVLDDEGLSWIGKRTRRAYSVGNPVKVQVERVDPLAGQMDLNLVRREGAWEGETGAGEGGRSRRGKARRRESMAEEALIEIGSFRERPRGGKGAPGEMIAEEPSAQPRRSKKSSRRKSVPGEKQPYNWQKHAKRSKAKKRGK